MRLIDADELLTHEVTIHVEVEEVGYSHRSIDPYWVETAPTIEAEPIKHGHWAFIGGYGYQYSCSVCISCAERKFKFCPNCGAKMDEVEV